LVFLALRVHIFELTIESVGGRYLMRLPAACNDGGLLEDEPFYTSFIVCAAANSSRKGAEQVRERLHAIATQELKIVPGGVRIFFPERSVLECSPFRFGQP
jgi:hypothetical protein